MLISRGFKFANKKSHSLHCVFFILLQNVEQAQFFHKIKKPHHFWRGFLSVVEPGRFLKRSYLFQICNYNSLSFKARCLKTTKPIQVNLMGFIFFIHNSVVSVRGAGEIRTPVQTCNYKAFFMFSFHLDFRPITG